MPRLAQTFKPTTPSAYAPSSPIHDGACLPKERISRVLVWNSSTASHIRHALASEWCKHQADRRFTRSSPVRYDTRLYADPIRGPAFIGPTLAVIWMSSKTFKTLAREYLAHRRAFG